jgi:hypothetical protein
MTNTNRIEDLGQRIERLVQEHIAASRKAAQEAVERAFASAARVPIGTARPVPRSPGKKRTSAQIAVLGERLYEAVSAKPGATMTVLAAEVGVSARELHRSVTLLRQAGRVRALGTRHLTRYFPIANRTAAPA